MRPRLFLLLTLASSIVLFGGTVARKTVVKAQQDATRNVFLGISAFAPATLALRGSSTLTVAIATGVEVPPTGADGVSPIKAVVEISATNVSNISHTVKSSKLQTVDVAGGGRASPAVFNFNISSQNTTTGIISYRATLVRLENNTGLAQMTDPMTSDASLTIGPAPAPTPTPAP